jgi:hypothetical protein
MAGEFAGLVGSGDVGRVTRTFHEAVAKSFEDDKSRITGAEVKRRFNFCCEIFRELRGDEKWSVQRCLDHLPKFLRCKVDRQPYDPKKVGLLWSPDGAKLVTPDGLL